MNQYTVHTPEGRIPVRPIAKLVHRGENFFLHVRLENADLIGITHTETGLSAGRINRYAGYRAMGMKRVAHSKARLLVDAAAHLARIPDDKFHAAMAKARGQDAS